MIWAALRHPACVARVATPDMPRALGGLVQEEATLLELHPAALCRNKLLFASLAELDDLQPFRVGLHGLIQHVHEASHHGPVPRPCRPGSALGRRLATGVVAPEHPSSGAGVLHGEALQLGHGSIVVGLVIII